MEIHRGYSRNVPQNDVALIVLCQGIEFGPNVKAIQMPMSINLRDGERLLVSGWGTTTEGGSGSDVLKAVYLENVPIWECARTYGGLKEDGHVCAGTDAGGRDSCQGDSGGPLVATRDGTPWLVGVVSSGFGCARPGVPGVYARVDKYVEWILEVA